MSFADCTHNLFVTQLTLIRCGGIQNALKYIKRRAFTKATGTASSLLAGQELISNPQQTFPIDFFGTLSFPADFGLSDVILDNHQTKQARL